MAEPSADATLRIVVLGRQGSGKGTQAARLSAIYGPPHVSTGDAFRAAAGSGSELGHTLKAYMDRGELVPDDVVEGVVKEHLFGPMHPRGSSSTVSLATWAKPRRWPRWPARKASTS